MALLPWLKGNVIKIEDHTYNTKRYWIQVQNVTQFDFKPGQFVTLDLPIHEKPNKRWRSYSIASWPDGSNVFELLVVLNHTGAGTPYLFNEVKVGSELTFRGPQGVFTLHEELDKDLFLICTGTGIAPFRSMLYYMKAFCLHHKNVYLVFGCRKKEDLLYFDEMKELENQIPNFKYLPVLSRENWEGHHGYVHQVYEEFCAARQPANFYLCGWKNMVDEAKKRIVEMGYDKKAIHLELYG